MPSPRFARLPPERRAHILGVAAAHIARDGADAASYNQIIAEAGISKTTAYLYFDGKDDLVRAVFGALSLRLADQLGRWRPTESAAAFWSQLADTSRALQQHLVDHPDELALLARAPAEAIAEGGDAWLAEMLSDGQARGVIRTDIPGALLAAATRALLRVGDAHVVAALHAGEPTDDEPVWALLASMWRAPSAGVGP